MSDGPRWVRVGPRSGLPGEAPDHPPAPPASPAEPTTLGAEADPLPEADASAPALARETLPEWTIPSGAGDGMPPDPADLETQLLARWRDERRRLTVVPAGGPPFAAQLLGAGRHVLYVADAEGRARLLYRWAIRELIPLED